MYNDTILKKTRLLNLVQQTFQAKYWQLHHWATLDNHYHLIGMSRKGRDLTNIIRQIHSKSAQWIREATSYETPIWWNYWDYCPRDEKDYLTRLNYPLTNPIKHNYINNWHDYPCSSFSHSPNDKGKDVLAKQFHDGPKYRGVEIEEDNF